MLSYNASHDIANAVLPKLDLPEVVSSKAEADSLNDRYLKDEDYIRNLVMEELSNYDTSDNHPSEIDDTIEDAISEIFFEIDDLVNDYYQRNHDETLQIYSEIVSSLENVSGVDSVEASYDPADPDVGIYEEVRTIEIKLTTGSTIYMTVEISEE